VQAQLDLLKEGATGEQIAVAQASEAQAQAALDLVRVMLTQAALRAPFDGIVAAVDVNPGEMVLPGQVVLVLGHQGQLRAETTDLSERDVWRISVGDQATVYVEALGTEVKGHIVRIAPRSSKVGGDVVYTVVAELDEQPADLRWGMSVKVEIATE
jgi:HlyD family secretion protein